MINVHKVPLKDSSRCDAILNAFKYLNKMYPNANMIAYGSAVLMETEPADIDLMVIGSSTASSQKVMDVSGIPFPLDIQFITHAEYQKKRENLDMALLSFWSCTPEGNVNIADADSVSLFTNNLVNTRNAVSAASSAAWAKGHKKLTVAEDYNEVLGIKNIIHSISFPQRAVEIMHTKKLLDNLLSNNTEQNVSSLLSVVKARVATTKYLHERSDDIYSAFGSTTEKWERFKEIAKPIYNTEMTKFRTYFPKEVK